MQRCDVRRLPPPLLPSRPPTGRMCRNSGHGRAAPTTCACGVSASRAAVPSQLGPRARQMLLSCNVACTSKLCFVVEVLWQAGTQAEAGSGGGLSDITPTPILSRSRVRGAGWQGLRGWGHPAAERHVLWAHQVRASRGIGQTAPSCTGWLALTCKFIGCSCGGRLAAFHPWPASVCPAPSGMALKSSIL